MKDFGFKRHFTFSSIVLVLLLFLSIDGSTQNLQSIASSPRAKENFDFNWQFHKGNIAIKRVTQAGGQGGITDINVEVVTKDTIIDYTNPSSYKVFNPADWKEVNLPHDWVVEGTFVHDNNLGNQPASNGYSFSQHANIWAILTNTFPETLDKAKVINTILNDNDLAQSTLYFKFYLFEALEKAGQANQFTEALSSWKEMVKEWGSNTIKRRHK